MSARTNVITDPTSGEVYPPAQTPQTKAHVADLVSKAKLMLTKDRKLMAQATEAWKNCVDAIHDQAMKARPKKANYEVHHMSEVARNWFLADIAEGLTPAEAEARCMQSLVTGFT